MKSSSAEKHGVWAIDSEKRNIILEETAEKTGMKQSKKAGNGGGISRVGGEKASSQRRNIGMPEAKQ